MGSFVTLSASQSRHLVPGYQIGSLQDQTVDLFVHQYPASCAAQKPQTKGTQKTAMTKKNSMKGRPNFQ